jgi:hypothetical protein
VADLEEASCEAVLGASDALACRWLGHLREAQAGWRLFRRIAKSMRHGRRFCPASLCLAHEAPAI